MAAKHGLGRGLGALMQEAPAASPRPAASAATSVPAGPASAPPASPTAIEAGGVTRIPVERIRPSPFQPRREFVRETLDELAASIRERGVLQPLLVRRAGDGYELIAGERRLRAAGEAGLHEVPAIVMDVTDRVALEVALVENLQRADLNAIEEADGYRELGEKFGLTQEEIATRVGKARTSVANALRLLALPAEVRILVEQGKLSAGHAKVLLGLTSEVEQRRLAGDAARVQVPVRELERWVARSNKGPRKAPRESQSDIPETHLARLSDVLHQHFGTRVRITPCRTMANGKKARGTLELDFYSNDDLDRILGVLGVRDEV